MKFHSMFPKLLTFGLLAVTAANADVLFTTSTPLTTSDPTQQGRISRQYIPQTWAGTEVFGGLINPTTSYYYETFSVDVGDTPYIQIEMDDPDTNLFVSGYQGAYLPDSSITGNLGFDTNWLGDAGGSGNYFGTDPEFFQVVAQPNSTLVVVVSETTPGAGIGHPFNLTVEGFANPDFGSPIPEPAAFLLTAGGLGLLAFRRRLFRRRS